jgi:septum formation protein
MTLHRPLILGSSSPYRRQLISRLGLDFACVSPDIDETPHAGETPLALSRRLAQQKAEHIAKLHPDAVVIGSDQVADLNGVPLNKPGTHEKAVAQLLQMSGQTLTFQTSVCVVCAATGFVQMDTATVHVRMRNLALAEIEAYLQAEPAYDCAGSAKCEGLGIALMESIESDDPTALVGLPLIRTCQMLRAAGVSILGVSNEGLVP